MAKSKFVYKGSDRSAEELSRKASEGARDYDSIFKSGIPIFKAKEGENCIRILPSTWDEPDWDYIIHQHRNVGPDNVSYLCLDKMKDGEVCPVCEAKRLATDKEEADELRIQKGSICWIIDRDDERTGPQVWQMPFTKVRNEIYARSVDKKTRAPILVDDPEEGFDINFTRVGTTVTTEYKAVEVARDPTPIHDDEKLQDKWLDYITENPLPSVLNFYPAEHIEKVLFGKKSAKTKEDAPEQEPVRGRRALATEEEPEPTARRSSRRGEPDPEEEAEAEPRASRLERRRAAVEEEDPPFERTRRGSRAEEEEAEAAPVGRGRSRAESAEEEESPTTQARASLERLKTRRRAS